MKLYKQILFILVVFFKTETVFSENKLFNVNNIELEKKDKISYNKLADQAIKKGFKPTCLIERSTLIIRQNINISKKAIKNLTAKRSII